jgi:acyl-CoA reductase-like NAD-dependent aldehyde dehydrogenase
MVVSILFAEPKKDADLIIGMKDSGYGRFGASGLEEWVRTKTVTFSVLN